MSKVSSPEQKRRLRAKQAHTYRPGGPWDIAKQKRRAEAAIRQAAYDKLTPGEKLDRHNAYKAAHSGA